MSEETRRRIVEAAVRALTSEGYAATSIKDIAGEAGVAPGLVHYYFATKEALIVAAIEYASQALRLPIEGDPTEFARAAFERAKREPEHAFSLLVLEMLALAPHNPAVRDCLLRYVRSERDHIESAARAVIAQREARPDSGPAQDHVEGPAADLAPAYAAAIWGALFGISVQAILERDFDRQAAIDLLAKMALEHRP